MMQPRDQTIPDLRAARILLILILIVKGPLPLALERRARGHIGYSISNIR